MKKYIAALIIILTLVCISVNAQATEYISDKLNTSNKDDINMIYGFEVKENKITLKDILEGGYFAEGINVYITDKANVEIENENKGVGTGSKITLSIQGGLIGKYKVVIYGDITGDGKITPVDALTLIKVINKKIEYVDAVCEEAGRIKTREEGKKPSAVDALAIIKHLNNKYKITQNRSLFCWDKTSDAWKEATTKNELNFKVIAKDEAGNRIEDITWEVSDGTLDTNKGANVNWTIPNVSNTYKITAKIDEDNILEKEIKYIKVESILENDEVETEEIEIEENGDEDSDGLTNKEEKELETNIFYNDTDQDGINDNDEVRTYKTDPLEKDTDGDEIEDLNEIILGLNPLNKDSDGDGILDNKEQTKYTAENTELGVSVEIQGDANIADTIIDKVELNELDNVEAIVSPVYSFYTKGQLNQAEVEISYDEAGLESKEIIEENLSLYYFDPTDYTFEEVSTQVDIANNKIKATLEHFSMYLIADKTKMISKLNNQIMFVIDNSASMYTKEQALEKNLNDDADESLFDDAKANDSEYKRLQIVSKLTNELDENFEFGLSKFTADAITLSEMGSSKEKIEEAIEKIKTEGENFNGTYIGSAIYSAAFYFNNTRAFNRYIVLITDGDDTAPSAGIIKDWAIETAKEKGIKIIAIGIGTEVKKATLFEYANETGGRYYHVQNVDDLEKIYSNIRSELNLKRETITNEDGKLEEYLVVADSGFTSEVNGLPFKNFETSRTVDEEPLGKCYGISQLSKNIYTGNLELTGNKNSNYMGKSFDFNYDLTSLEFFKNYTNLINYEFESEIIEKIFKSSKEEIYDYEKLEKDLNAGAKKIHLGMKEEYKKCIEQTNGVIKIHKDTATITGYGKGTADFIYIDMDKLTNENVKKFPDFQLFKVIEYFHVTQLTKDGYGPDYDKQIFFENPKVLDDTIEKINSGIPVVISYKTYSSSIGSTFQWLISHADHAVNGIRVLRNIHKPDKYKVAIYNNNNPRETQYLNVEKVKTLFGTTLCCYEQDGHCTNIYVEK